MTEPKRYKRRDPTKYKIVIYVVMTTLMIFWFFDAQRTAQEKVLKDVQQVDKDPKSKTP